MGDDKKAGKGLQIARQKLELVQGDLEGYALSDLFPGMAEEIGLLYNNLLENEAKLANARNSLRYDQFNELTQASFSLVQAINQSHAYQNYCMFIVEDKRNKIEEMLEIKVQVELSKRLTNATAIIKENLMAEMEQKKLKYKNKIKKLRAKVKDLKHKLENPDAKPNTNDDEEQKLVEQNTSRRNVKVKDSEEIPDWIFQYLLENANLKQGYDNM